MSIDSIQFIAPGAGLDQLIGQQRGHAGAPFVGWLERELVALNEQILNSDLGLRQLAAGENTNLHQVMLELEKSKTSFQLAVEIRNKLLEGYQDVMRMQV